jgi:hypothetical protein
MWLHVLFRRVDQLLGAGRWTQVRFYYVFAVRSFVGLAYILFRLRFVPVISFHGIFQDSDWFLFQPVVNLLFADDDVLKGNVSGLSKNRSTIDLATINKPNRFKKQVIHKEEVDNGLKEKPVRILKNAMKGNNRYKS